MVHNDVDGLHLGWKLQLFWLLAQMIKRRTWGETELSRWSWHFCTIFYSQVGTTTKPWVSLLETIFTYRIAKLDFFSGAKINIPSCATFGQDFSDFCHLQLCKTNDTSNGWVNTRFCDLPPLITPNYISIRASVGD